MSVLPAISQRFKNRQIKTANRRYPTLLPQTAFCHLILHHKSRIQPIQTSDSAETFIYIIFEYSIIVYEKNQESNLISIHLQGQNNAKTDFSDNIRFLCVNRPVCNFSPKWYTLYDIFIVLFKKAKKWNPVRKGF